MSWLYLLLAIIFETIGTTGMKLSNGFSVLLPSILIYSLFFIPFFCIKNDRYERWLCNLVFFRNIID